MNNKLLATAVVAVIAGGLAGMFAPPIFQEVLVEDKQVATVQEQEPAVRVAENASPAVVSVIIKKKSRDLTQESGSFLFEQFGFHFPFETPAPAPVPEQESRQRSEADDELPEELVSIGGGSGFIVSSDGLIVTNRHVVSDDKAVYSVILNDESEHTATVKAQDRVLDIAILKINAQNLPVLTLGNSDNVRIGQTVIAIGNTLSEFSNTVTQGVISGIGRRVFAGGFEKGSEVIEQALQTDAAINPGNSGGPLFNIQGEVIGVATATSLEGEAVSFAIPINAVKRIVDSVQKNGRIVRAWLGVRYSLITPDMVRINKLPVDHGALIARGGRTEELAIIPGSPADKAGLEENNIILEFDGKRIDLEHSLAYMVSQHNPGDAVTLKLYDDGETRNVAVTLGEYPEDAE